MDICDIAIHTLIQQRLKLSASRTQDLADVSRMLGLADESTLTKIKSVVKVYISTAMEDLESLILLGKLEVGN